ncbi:carbon-nitrogen hydrolase family protein [Magnetovibrio sp. PR-2]|uniref:carbon-nitrogen hydrolase family protein n=1 Tax=Magnetovibrio sp. PR-2 TaxID=3120356 RepID=UPI002FCE3142
MSNIPPAFKAACVQVNASNDMDENIRVAVDYVRQAAGQGAELVFLPENVAMMTFGDGNIRANARTMDDHPAIPAFSALAKELGVWLHGGTLAIDLGDKIANRAFVYSPNGDVVATYDKIHMFDVDLEGGESYRESATFSPGTDKVLIDTPWGGLGLSTCYDVRFPYLYRALANAGATMLSVPAAFTVPTGTAHWHVLLRARAIENGCFVFAPAQVGTHFNDRKTFGHSLIIDPWGEVLADAGDEPGVVVADIDPVRVVEARKMVPSLTHTRDIS